MDYDLYSATEGTRYDRERLDCRAYKGWRYRNFKTRPGRVIETMLSSVLGFLVR